MGRDSIVCGLDIGTTKICSIIGEIGDDGTPEIIGVGTSPSLGLRKGVVVNLEETIKSVERAMEEALVMAGVGVSSVFIGIAGSHIKGVNSRGFIGVSRGDREITKHDIDRVINHARTINIPLDREVIHVIPQGYIVDNQDGIRSPLGMTGMRLDVEVHIVTGAASAIQNVVKCVNRAGFEVEQIVLQPLASSQAILSPDEKDLGVAVVDLGGGTTDIAVFIDGGLWYSGILPLGGNHLTRDLAIGLRTSRQEAEGVKKRHGCALCSMVGTEDIVEVSTIGDTGKRGVARTAITEIIEPRMEEIFSLVRRELVRSGFHERLAAGAVLTGGASLLSGAQAMAEDVLSLPVRIGAPRGITGLVDIVSNPIYATGVGLLLYGSSRRNGRNGRHGRSRRGAGRLVDWILRWWGDGS